MAKSEDNVVSLLIVAAVVVVVYVLFFSSDKTYTGIADSINKKFPKLDLQSAFDKWWFKTEGWFMKLRDSRGNDRSPAGDVGLVVSDPSVVPAMPDLTGMMGSNDAVAAGMYSYMIGEPS